MATLLPSEDGSHCHPRTLQLTVSFEKSSLGQIFVITLDSLVTRRNKIHSRRFHVIKNVYKFTILLDRPNDHHCRQPTNGALACHNRTGKNIAELDSQTKINFQHKKLKVSLAVNIRTNFLVFAIYIKIKNQQVLGNWQLQNKSLCLRYKKAATTVFYIFLTSMNEFLNAQLPKATGRLKNLKPLPQK